MAKHDMILRKPSHVISLRTPEGEIIARSLYREYAYSSQMRPYYRVGDWVLHHYPTIKTFTFNQITFKTEEDKLAFLLSI